VRAFLTKILPSMLGFIILSPAYGADIMPSHVYQKTELLRLTLEHGALLDTDIYKKEEEKDNALRHPRHVMQKVRECNTVLSKMLRAQEIESSPFPEDLYAVNETTPSDVLRGVEHLLSEVHKISPNIEPDIDFDPNKVPLDVYNNLKRICHALRAEIVPSDVYQIAVGVNNNMNDIVAARGYIFETPYRTYKDKIPADVYQRTQRFMTDLRKLSLHSDFAIPGGVIVPDSSIKFTIEPQDVIALMNDALAETTAIKYTLGTRNKLPLPPYEDDKVPADVFAQIERAHRIVKTLLEKEQAK